MQDADQIPDHELIDALGGPLALLQRLGWPRRYGLQRICNWRARGIPYKARLELLPLWKEAGEIVMAHRNQGTPLPTYWQRRRAAAAKRVV